MKKLAAYVKNPTPIIVALSIALGIWINPMNPAFADQQTGELTVKVVGLDSGDGAVRIGLFSTPETYEAKSGPFRGTSMKIEGLKCVWVLDKVPYGDYAVML